MNKEQKMKQIQKILEEGERIKIGWVNNLSKESISISMTKRWRVDLINPRIDNPYSWLLDLSVDDNFKKKDYENMQKIYSLVEFENKNDFVNVYEGDNVIGLYNPIDHIPDNFDEMSEKEQDDWEYEDASDKINKDLEEDRFENQDSLDKLLKIALEYLE